MIRLLITWFNSVILGYVIRRSREQERRRRVLQFRIRAEFYPGFYPRQRLMELGFQRFWMFWDWEFLKEERNDILQSSIIWLFVSVFFFFWRRRSSFYSFPLRRILCFFFPFQSLKFFPSTAWNLGRIPIKWRRIVTTLTRFFFLTSLVFFYSYHFKLNQKPLIFP